MLSRAALFAACTLSLPALACRSDGNEAGAGGGEAPATDTAAPGVTPVSSPDSDSLDVQLEMPMAIRVGEPVTITMHVRNTTQRAVDLYLRGRTLTFDVVIARADGEVVYQRLEGEVIPAIVHLRTLAAEDRIELQVAWDPRTREGELLPPGDYVVRGLLLTEGEPLETPSLSFEIVP